MGPLPTPLPSHRLQQVDAALLAMAYDAEHGRSYSLPVRLALTGGAVITGTPTSSAHYFDEMEEMARQEAKVRLQSGQKWREEDKAMLDEWTTSMREVWAVMRSAAQGDGAGGVMTLAPVTMWFPDGSTLAVPAVRVPLGQVSAWWVAGSRAAPPESEGTFAFGAIFPLPSS